jgi:hypothetical protein
MDLSHWRPDKGARTVSQRHPVTGDPGDQFDPQVASQNPASSRPVQRTLTWTVSAVSGFRVIRPLHPAGIATPAWTT